MISVKNAVGILLLVLITLVLISIPSEAADDRAMYRVDASNSGYYPETSNNNTYSPIPIWEEESSFTTYSNPILVDINDDSVKDIIYGGANGKLKALSGDYSVLWEFKTNATQLSTPAAADIDRDGDMDIVFVAKEEDPKLFCLDNEGNEKWNFTLPSFSTKSFPTIAQITNDPGLEILISSGQTTIGIMTSTSLYCISSMGEEIWKYHTSEWQAEITSTPVVADIMKDSAPEIIFGVTGAVGIFVLDNEGKLEWTANPGYRYTSPTTYDITKNGVPEVLIGMGYSVYCYKSDGQKLWHFNADEPIFSTPFARDIDEDGEVEILIASDSLYCLKADGTLKWKQPLNHKAHYSSISFGDINTGTPEILVGDINGTLYAFSNTGEKIWEVKYGTAMQSCPVIADVNGDGTPELFLTLERGDHVITSFLDLPLTPITPEFDFEIGQVSMQPLFPVADHEVSFTVQVFNKGNVFSSTEVILNIDNVTVYSKYVAIPPGTNENGDGFSIETTLHWIGVTGHHYVEIIIDPENSVEETLENNNDYSTIIYVVAEFIDLVITKDDITISQIENLEFYRLAIKIRNLGNLPTGNFSMKLTINGVVEIISGINLGPESFTINYNTLSLDQGTDFLISVQLDPEDKVFESNETNNLADLIVNLKNSGGDGDPIVEDFVYLLFILPIVVLAMIIYYNNRSTKKNNDLMQNTLSELKNSFLLANMRQEHYFPGRYGPPEGYGRPDTRDEPRKPKQEEQLEEPTSLPAEEKKEAAQPQTESMPDTKSEEETQLKELLGTVYKK